MFGMALRTYQKRVQRLNESLSFRDQTLWEAVVELISTTPAVTRKRIISHFSRAPAEQVGAALNDLVVSGLVYCTGRGHGAVFGMTSDADRKALHEAEEKDARANLVWLGLYQCGPITFPGLVSELGMASQTVPSAVDVLVERGRVTRSPERPDASELLHNSKLSLRAQQPGGWESAFLDHFRAMTTALANKLRLGLTEPTPGVGGTTYTFDVHDAHPHREQVINLLNTLRSQVVQLWAQVSTYN